MHSVKYYKEQMNQNDKKIQLTLENLRKSYPLFKTTKSAEYSKIYFNDVKNVETVFHDVYLLQNELLKDSNALSKELEQNNKLINKYEKELKQTTKIFDNVSNKDLASKPRMKNSKTDLQDTYINTVLISIGIVGCLYISYKQIRSF